MTSSTLRNTISQFSEKNASNDVQSTFEIANRLSADRIKYFKEKVENLQNQLDKALKQLMESEKREKKLSCQIESLQRQLDNVPQEDDASSSSQKGNTSSPSSQKGNTSSPSYMTPQLITTLVEKYNLPKEMLSNDSDDMPVLQVPLKSIVAMLRDLGGVNDLATSSERQEVRDTNPRAANDNDDQTADTTTADDRQTSDSSTSKSKKKKKSKKKRKHLTKHLKSNKTQKSDKLTLHTLLTEGYQQEGDGDSSSQEEIEVKKQGWAQERKSAKKWTPHYFVLTSNRIFSFKTDRNDPTDKKNTVLSVIDLEDAKLEIYKSGDASNCFSISSSSAPATAASSSTTNLSKQQQQLVIKVDTKKELRDWMGAIKTVIVELSI
eukprot:CAMPEP_0201560590 /NCGR_PEP_ID=MMETSP0173_2-20130828/78348_1 /ASSEMBLY_ACC=CAM_ASM_000268 /TAXON_ID=218659 /ORGANISM="Vexillifera sp., Strain DIVA3 564/2" /LENGTH=378 /DNA_ID=CAMNT_0047975045 /DNA_START=277 /DNA_END=1413 /DNA_ORIENTATION=-